MYIRNFAIILCILGLFACEEYEEYIKDYDYSAVYFGTQKPLRTIVAYDQMQFKVGVTLAGKRENNREEWVTFGIDESLLDDTPFTLLPEEYYSLSNEEMMVVPKGEFIGDVTVTLDKAAFTADPLAHENTYALPLRLYETSADSILSGQFDDAGNELTPAKDYTVLVVKYISDLHGVYYHKGIEQELDDQGEVVALNTFSTTDLSSNQTWSLSTISLDEVETSGTGTNVDNGLKLTRNTDNTVMVEEAAGSDLTVVDGEGTYNEEDREFYLNYSYINEGTTYNVIDTLILRQPPELDLRFEEW